jgi:signal transduction histidine kinase
MAAVVAHEVKIPIAGIRGALQVIVSRMPADERDRSVVREIVASLGALNGIMQGKAFNACFTTKHRGTGLGLSIARRVVEAHGGHIDIAAAEGGGTVPSFALPCHHG